MSRSRVLWPSVTPRLKTLYAALGAALLLLLAYAPALNGEFVWDDDDNILNRDVVKAAGGIWRIWADVHSTQQYYPLTHTTFWLQYQLFGANPFPFHVLNLALHGLGVWLLWRLLQRLGVPGAGLAAALFAVHPLQVESVAWITERKNVLSLPLALASAWFFTGHHLGAGQAPLRRFGSNWVWSLVFFVLALAAKTSLSVLPAVFVLYLWWKKGRLSLRDALELAPFFAVGLGAGLLTAWIEVTGVAAQGHFFSQGPVLRVLRAAHIFWFYIGKLLFPLEQSFVYPMWTLDTGSVADWGMFVLTLGAFGTAIALALRGRRALLFGLGAYAVLIFPALGFFNVAFMRWAFVQDHFSYAAVVPLLALVTAGLTRLRIHRAVLRAGLAAALCVALTALSFRHAAHFATYLGLFEHALSHAPESWLVNHNLGVLYQAEHRPKDAIVRYRAAIASNPELAAAQNNLGALLFMQGDRAEGLQHMREAVRWDPVRLSFGKNYAQAAAEAGDEETAVAQFRRVLELDPDWVKGQRLLAWLLATSHNDSLRDGRAAVSLAQQACANTRSAVARCVSTLAAAQAEAGDFAGAMRSITRAIELAGGEGEQKDAQRYQAMAQEYAAGRPYRVAPGQLE